jgi:hypothetical protein
MDCEKCPYRVVEAVPEHLREQVGSDEWESCDADKIGVDAADRLTAVLGELERVTRERDAAVEVTVHMRQHGTCFPRRHLQTD